MTLVMRQQFARRSPAKFLEFFGQLARDAQLTVGDYLETGGQSFQDSKWGFEKY